MCFSVYAATDSRGGAWTAEVDGESIQMTIFLGNQVGEGHRTMGEIIGFSVPLASFGGLSAVDVASNAANVKFELRQPAGAILFDGRFSDGTGAGHFRFTPSDAFVREMGTLDFSGFSDDQILCGAQFLATDDSRPSGEGIPADQT